MLGPTTILPTMTVPLGAPVLASGRLELSTSSLDTFLGGAHSDPFISEATFHLLRVGAGVVGGTVLATGLLWLGTKALRQYLASKSAALSPVDVTDELESVPPPPEATTASQQATPFVESQSEPQPATLFVEIPSEPRLAVADDDQSTVRKDILAPYSLPPVKLPPEMPISARLEAVLKATRRGDVGTVRVFIRRLNVTKGPALPQHQLDGKLLGLKDGKAVVVTKSGTYLIPLVMIEQVRYLKPDGRPDYDWNAEMIHPQVAPEMRDMELYPASRAAEDRQVLIDFSDPRVVNFFRYKMAPLREGLDAKRISRGQAAKRAWDLIRNMHPVDPKKIRQTKQDPAGLYRLGDFVLKGSLDERAMLLQVGLQYIGIPSRYQKGFIPLLAGKHAWVQVELDGNQVILDPAQTDPIVKPAGSNGHRLYGLYSRALEQPEPPQEAAALRLSLAPDTKWALDFEQIDENDLRRTLALAGLEIEGEQIFRKDLERLRSEQALHVLYQVFGSKFEQSRREIELQTISEVWDGLNQPERLAWWALEGRSADGGLPEVFLRNYIKIRREAAEQADVFTLNSGKHSFDEKKLRKHMLDCMKDSLQESDTLMRRVIPSSDVQEPAIERVVPMRPVKDQPFRLLRRRSKKPGATPEERAVESSMAPTQRAVPQPAATPSAATTSIEVMDVRDEELVDGPPVAPRRAPRPRVEMPKKAPPPPSPMESAVRKVADAASQKPKAKAPPPPKRLSELTLSDLDFETAIDHAAVRRQIDQQYEAEKSLALEPAKRQELEQAYKVRVAHYDKFMVRKSTLGEIIRDIDDEQLMSKIFANFQSIHPGLRAPQAARQLAIKLVTGFIELRREKQRRRDLAKVQAQLDAGRDEDTTVKMSVLQREAYIEQMSLDEAAAMFDSVPPPSGAIPVIIEVPAQTKPWPPAAQAFADVAVEAPAKTEPWPPATAAPVVETAEPAQQAPTNAPTQRRRFRSFGASTAVPEPEKATQVRRRRFSSFGSTSKPTEQPQPEAEARRRRFRSF